MTPTEAQTMWDLAHRFWPPGSVFRYFARHPEGRVFGYSLNSPASLARITDWSDANGFNSYWGINPTKKRHGTRCSTSDITHWRWFPIDIDPLEGAGPYHLMGAAEVLPIYLTNAKNLTQFLIDSGRGYQILLPLSGTVNTAAQTMAYHLSLLHGRVLNRKCIVDTSCSDLPRVMRLPHTINQKTGRRSTIITSPTEVNEGLAEWLEAAVPERIATPTITPTNHASWTDYTPSLPVTAKRFLEGGVKPPNRHNAATATMLSLRDGGATMQQTLEALHWGASLCDPPLPPKDIDYMVNRRKKEFRQ